jgi:hypothetical protein
LATGLEEVQPNREIRANKSKFMKGNDSENPFIFFHFLFLIGRFQRVTVEKNKKISAYLNSRFGLWARISLAFALPSPHLPAGARLSVVSVGP